jgi:hypothetical protein
VMFADDDTVTHPKIQHHHDVQHVVGVRQSLTARVGRP